MKKNRVDKYINFKQFPNPGKKSKVWGVYSTRGFGDPVGTIKWYGAWRKYCFYPGPGTWFDKDCLILIAEFLIEETKKQFEK